MAIITRIRKQSTIAVLVITIGLLLFLLGSDLLSPNSSLLGRNKQIVGSIDGVDISLNEFSAKVEEIKIRYQQQYQRTPGESEMDYLRAEAWNELVYEIALKKEYDKLGLTVTDEEVKDMVQGNNIDPGIAASFTDPQTGKVDKKKIQEFLANLKKMPPEQRMQFEIYESRMRPLRVRQKYEKLLSLSYYATNYEAKREYKFQNDRVDLRYVFVPFSKIADSTIKVSDAQLMDYFNQNKDKYKKPANRAIEYLAFPFPPSGEDTAAIRKQLEELAAQFAATSEDTAFADANSEEGLNIKTYTPAELPRALNLNTVEKGKVYGPFLDAGKFKLYKILDTKDDTIYSARASHILLKPGDFGGDKAKAKAKAEEIMARLKQGADFEQIARTESGDGSRSQGGDLGWFKKGMMVPEFEKAVMDASSEGLVPRLVETNYGYHIIKVTGVKTKKQFQVASITKEITASEETRAKAYNAAGAFAKASDEKEYFEKIKNTPGTISLQALTIPEDAKYINDMNGPKVRDIVRWIYNDAKVGSISEVFELDDRFVVVIVRSAQNADEPRLEDVKEQVIAEVRKNIKTEQITQKLQSAGKGANTTLEQYAAVYGNEITIINNNDVSMSSSALTGVGYAPIAIGKAFALKQGQRTAPFRDENGVMVLELVKTTPAADVADYNSYKQQLTQARSSQVQSAIMEAIKKLAKVENNLAKFY